MSRHPLLPTTFDKIILSTQTSFSPVPRITELTPQEEIERLQAEIADARDTILRYASRPLIVDNALSLIERNEVEIEQWKAVIYAADQQAANDAATGKKIAELFSGVQVEYPDPLRLATRAEFVENVRGK